MVCDRPYWWSFCWPGGPHSLLDQTYHFRGSWVGRKALLLALVRIFVPLWLYLWCLWLSWVASHAPKRLHSSSFGSSRSHSPTQGMCHLRQRVASCRQRTEYPEWHSAPQTMKVHSRPGQWGGRHRSTCLPASATVSSPRLRSAWSSDWNSWQPVGDQTTGNCRAGKLASPTRDAKSKQRIQALPMGISASVCTRLANLHLHPARHPHSSARSTPHPRSCWPPVQCVEQVVGVRTTPTCWRHWIDQLDLHELHRRWPFACLKIVWWRAEEWDDEASLSSPAVPLPLYAAIPKATRCLCFSIGAVPTHGAEEQVVPPAVVAPVSPTARTLRADHTCIWVE